MPNVDKLLDLLNELVRTGRILLEDAVPQEPDGQLIFGPEERRRARRWASDLILLKTLGGDLVSPWAANLSYVADKVYAADLEFPLAAVESIRAAINKGRLIRFQDLVIAEMFVDLLEQAEYLFSQGYFLATGVMCRAVLEEKLRNLCERNNCIPAMPRPTIEAYNQALYKASPPVYDATVMKHVSAMASVGNHAAHNKPDLRSDTVERLSRDLRKFLADFSTR